MKPHAEIVNVRAAHAQSGSGMEFCSGESKSLSRCSLGCVARSF